MASKYPLFPNQSADHKVPVLSNWLQQNYESQEGISLQRSTLYEAYSEHCRSIQAEAVNTATFGKIIRCVFPNIKTRRLGTRGNSKYHYYGIRPKNGEFQQKEIINRKKGGRVESRKPTKENVTLPNTEEFLSILNEKIPNHSSQYAKFVEQYKLHCVKLLTLIGVHDFEPVGITIKKFWSQWNPENITQEFMMLISIMDDALYQYINHSLLGNMMESISHTATQAIGQFFRSFESILIAALEPTSMRAVLEVKVEAVQSFTQVLKRKASLNHLSQAVRSVLSNQDQVNQMILDWSVIDFKPICQSWILDSKSQLFYFVESSFKNNLRHSIPLESWTLWLDAIIDQSIVTNLEEESKQFILQWSYFCSQVMRELTLKSSPSFGSFHLIRMLFDEYISYSVEKKLSGLPKQCDIVMNQIRRQSEYELDQRKVFDDFMNLESKNDNSKEMKSLLSDINVSDKNENNDSIHHVNLAPKKKIRVDSSLATILNG